MYGSARLGIAQYWPMQYGAAWDYENGTADTARLLGRAPWYSYALNSHIAQDSIFAYGSPLKNKTYAQHLLGQKLYEECSHLGNVQVVVSDKRYVKTDVNGNWNLSRAALPSVYDYYPFGMLMHERSTQDTATQITYATQVVSVPNMVFAPLPVSSGWTHVLGTVITYGPGVTASGNQGGMSYQVTGLAAGMPATLSVYLAYIRMAPCTIKVTDNVSGTVLANVNANSTGSYTLPFTPSGTTVTVSLTLNVSFSTSAALITIKGGSYTQQQGMTEMPLAVAMSNKGGDRYEFGFNGQFKDNEVAGIGNHLDFGERHQDPRIARFWSLDPKAKQFPNESPYLFAGNNPIFYIDKNGEHKVSADSEAAYRRDYPLIMKYLSTQLALDVAKSTKVVNGLVAANPNIQPATVKSVFQWGNGPEIVFKDAPGEFPMEFKSAAGYTRKDDHVIELNSGYAAYVERVLASNASADVKQATFMRFYMTVIHETSHELNKYGRMSHQNAAGAYLYYRPPGGKYSQDEQGYKAEENIWGGGSYKPFSAPAFDASIEGVEGIASDKYQPGVVEGVISEAEKTPEGRASLPTVPTR